ncbi:MAG: hypothetical protein Q9M91_01005 [Candidatus Dojkabacteria bacterium]|nr:hypothetical protein [Candidatus Dojkabacteria bacterium]MDQ7020405.1 hypothetical protein [Candidatus Dojkabacteria bacterium]
MMTALTIILGIIITPIALIFLFRIYGKIRKALKPSEKWKLSLLLKLNEYQKRIHTSDINSLKSLKNDLEKLLAKIFNKKGVSGSSFKDKVKNSSKLLSKEECESLKNAIKIKDDSVDKNELKDVINAMFDASNSILTKSN